MRRVLSNLLVPCVIVTCLLSIGAIPAGAAAGGSVLWPGERLNRGQSIVSPNGHYRLILQHGGNLVLYGPGGGPTGALWASNTTNGLYLDMQGDGNVVLYPSSGPAVWATWTQNNPGSWLQIQNDGNLVVYRPGAVAIYPNGGSNQTGVANPYPDAVVNHNIAGNHGTQTEADSGSSQVHLKMVFERPSLSGLPWSITLQEVCGNQAYYLATFLNGVYPGQYWVKFQNNYFYRSNGSYTVGNLSAGCTEGYGNLVAIRSPGFIPQIVQATYAGSDRVGTMNNESFERVERKGYTCVEGGVGSPLLFGCSTHFWPGSVAGIAL